MGSFVWAELVCCVCSSTLAGRFILSDRVPRSEMATHAKKNGWTRIRHEEHHDWLCGYCTSKRKKTTLSAADAAPFIKGGE
jgi:hypothetical protein